MKALGWILQDIAVIPLSLKLSLCGDGAVG